ncbi:RNA polymerase sigma factor [Hephaestia sp. GCM10023244]|uniref:RNA polymerase sigma factor n=1 Tax=unclassified Hephaestia TaxID=2631281 RepID=UPI0020775064|nr:RNA polymerase sigma factor [Hephaestia sp. MAHUQ-44]MCM8732414.1 RNA polymerase sigma factor [Hephaestia sp. MAHUQ-44]
MSSPRASGAALDAVRACDPLPPEDRKGCAAQPSLDDLYRDERPRLFRLFRRRVGAGEAQDLVQEAFARFAGRKAQPVEAIAEPEAYLTRLATNLLRDRAKFAVRRAAAYHQSFNDDVAAGPDPADQLERRDLLRRLDAAVKRLRPRTREVFLLQRVEGLTYAEIAGRTGMSVKAVKKQIAKALFDLRRDLGNQ